MAVVLSFQYDLVVNFEDESTQPLVFRAMNFPEIKLKAEGIFLKTNLSQFLIYLGNVTGMSEPMEIDSKNTRLDTIVPAQYHLLEMFHQQYCSSSHPFYIYIPK